jgi:ATPase subunit of ABC transporter with duplicated ATPase domains
MPLICLQDLPATLWLESYLTDDVETTLVVTSHDQEFLNRVVDETIFIRALTLRYFEGCGPSFCRVCDLHLTT